MTISEGKAANKQCAVPQQGKPLQLYLAAPLFTLQERCMNRKLAEAVERAIPGSNVLLPQDFKHRERYNDDRAFGVIFQSCLDGIDSSHCILAWLDGPDSDSGSCFEVGYAYAKGIPTVGIRTDFRLNQERGVNVMLSRGCSYFVYRPSFDEDVEGLARDVARAVKKALNGKVCGKSL
jgi:nucleoside 2-deoxyribosyltransferase